VRWPRKGILIRLCIYVPVLLYLSWRAIERWRAPAADPQVDGDLDRKLAPHKRIISLPDGTQQEIVELTPEQAEAILGPIPALEKADPGPAPGDASTKAPAPR
jgi:hypothetical protein